MNRQRTFLPTVLLLFGLTLAAPLYGLGAHELVVVANRNEPVSIEIAKSYMQMRHIPAGNLVLVAVAPSSGEAYHTISRTGFTARIWNPVQSAIEERGLTHTLAWVYATHIPYRVEMQPPVSVQGLTFLRNQLPPAADIARGRYVSPLFAGPDHPQGKAYPAQSFLIHRELLGAAMPLPSMALGYMGPLGNTQDEVLAMLQKASGADGSNPDGIVYLINHADVRSRSRSWQFDRTVSRLQHMNVKAVVTNQLPQSTNAILGVMEGKATVAMDGIGRFVPGAVAEHLTSFAAAFDQPGQTKLSRWIAAGASGTAGTVSEPHAIWTKFPHARFFVHYRRGCTMLESYYLSIRSPLQLMLIGDPLAAPWAPAATLQIRGISDVAMLTSPQPIDLHIGAPVGVHYSRFVYLVDGRVVGQGPQFQLDPDAFSAGVHTLRAVAYRKGLVRSQIMDTVRFVVRTARD